MRMEQESLEARMARDRADWWALILFLLCVIALDPLVRTDVNLQDGSFHSEHVDIVGTNSGLPQYYNSADQRLG